MAKMLEFWTGSHGEIIVVAGSTIDDDISLDVALAELGQQVPFNGDPSIAESETDLTRYFDKQPDALTTSGTEDAVRPYLDGERKLELPFDVIAVGGKAALALSLSEVPRIYHSQTDVLSDATIRRAIEDVAGDHAAIMFPTVIVEDNDLPNFYRGRS